MRQRREDLGPDDALPLQLQIRVLRSQLERINSDLYRLDEVKTQLMEEIGHCENLLVHTKRIQRLRIVK
ncbi:MAG: hypothetical protein V3R94_00730 [Acidobacteriota bacterium]